YGDGQNTYVTLSVAAVADLLKADKVEIAPKKLKIGPREIAINADGSAGIDFGGTLKERFKTVSLWYVVNDDVLLQDGKPRQVAASTFKDKVVLIGGFAIGTQDVKSTPFARDDPGVVKHAAEVDALLNGRFIVDAPLWVSVLVTLMLALLSVIATLMIRRPLFELIFPIALFF